MDGCSGLLCVYISLLTMLLYIQPVHLGNQLFPSETGIVCQDWTCPTKLGRLNTKQRNLKNASSREVNVKEISFAVMSALLSCACDLFTIMQH